MHTNSSMYPAVYLYKQDVWHGKKKKYEQADMFTENQKQSVPSLSLVSCGQPPSKKKKKISFSLFSFLFSFSFVVNSIYSWMLLPTLIQTKWKDPRHPIALLHPSLNKKRNKYTSLSSRKHFLRIDSNVQCFLREGLHVAPWGRAQHQPTPFIFNCVKEWEEKKSTLSFSKHAAPPSSVAWYWVTDTLIKD